MGILGQSIIFCMSAHTTVTPSTDSVLILIPSLVDTILMSPCCYALFTILIMIIINFISMNFVVLADMS